MGSLRQQNLRDQFVNSYTQIRSQWDEFFFLYPYIQSKAQPAIWLSSSKSDKQGFFTNRSERHGAVILRWFTERISELVSAPRIRGRFFVVPPQNDTRCRPPPYTIYSILYTLSPFCPPIYYIHHTKYHIFNLKSYLKIFSQPKALLSAEMMMLKADSLAFLVMTALSSELVRLLALSAETAFKW